MLFLANFVAVGLPVLTRRVKVSMICLSFSSVKGFRVLQSRKLAQFPPQVPFLCGSQRAPFLNFKEIQ